MTGTVCLTGDLHHMGLGTGNQAHSDITEIQTAQRFMEIVEEAGLKVTFFVSGKAFLDEWDDLRPVATHPLVELGGHNYNCLTPPLVHRVSKKIFRSYNGPALLQRWDAEKTSEIIRNHTGQRIRCWRNHMYMHGPNTERVLAEAGMRVCSDGTSRESRGPEWHPAGLYNFPLNVIPDHEHLYHAERTPEWVAAWQKRYNWSDDWGAESYDIDRWVDLVIADLERNRARGAVSNMIIHPITMYLCDNFSGFRRIVEVLRTMRTVHMGEVIDEMGGMP
ncbi:MAG: polysaccharide deacetylase family protein [Myxococcales bacterium]|nr:polysaccharide deacetylase family protein [Myxococcales bacterium]